MKGWGRYNPPVHNALRRSPKGVGVHRYQVRRRRCARAGPFAGHGTGEREGRVYRIFPGKNYFSCRTSRAPSSYAFLQSSGNCSLCRSFFASGSNRGATYFE